ncbi:MAG: hypothetical protein HYU78_03540 [Rhodocyclales bacterium]|nr:hypothetical protein [Rhodocyclales bacterium]
MVRIMQIAAPGVNPSRSKKTQSGALGIAVCRAFAVTPMRRKRAETMPPAAWRPEMAYNSRFGKQF